MALKKQANKFKIDVGSLGSQVKIMTLYILAFETNANKQNIGLLISFPLARYDLPTMIMYVVQHTGSKISYVGHSQGRATLSPRLLTLSDFFYPTLFSSLSIPPCFPPFLSPLFSSLSIPPCFPPFLSPVSSSLSIPPCFPPFLSPCFPTFLSLLFSSLSIPPFFPPFLSPCFLPFLPLHVFFPFYLPV